MVFLLAYRGGTLLRFAVARRSIDATLLSRVSAILSVIYSREREAPSLVLVNDSRLFAFTVNDGPRCCITLSHGMIEPLSDGELAGLLAHECGHIEEDHPQRLAVVLGMLASVKFSMGVPLLAAVAALLAYLMMVRHWEFAADMRAARIIGPSHLLTAFSRYMEISGDRPPSHFMEFFCAHPSMDRRMRILRHFAASSDNPEKAAPGHTKPCTTASSQA